MICSMSSQRSVLDTADRRTVHPPRRPIGRMSLLFRRIRVQIARFGWAAGVPVIIVLPLLLSSDAGLAGNIVLELSLAAGLLATSLLVITVVAVSRIRSLAQAFGIERLIVSHRWLGIFSMVLVLAHTGLVIASDPRDNVQLITWVHAPARARNATASTVCILLICLFAVFRRKLNWPYEAWRWIHIGLAIGALVTAAFHVYLLDHLIRNPAMRAWFLGLAAVLLLTLAKRWVLRPLFRRNRSFVVDAVIAESPLVSTIVLRPRYSWQGGMKFAPGQFAWIRINDSRKPWEEHPFTIASNAHQPRELEFTIRHVGDFTRTIARLRPGASVRVDGPYGDFTVDNRQARSLLLIAGGVGVTPMMSILRTLAHRGDFRPASLVMGARHYDDLLFRAELADLSYRLPLRVFEVLSDPPASWDGLHGRIDAHVLSAALPSRRHRVESDVYICGSPPMVSGVLESLRQLGIPGERIHTEQFDMI
jgi:predicted ferric reductase